MKPLKIRKKRNQHTAMIVPLEVYNGKEHVAQGYMLVREDGVQSPCVMWNDNDEQIDENVWGQYSIIACTMIQKLCVVPVKVM